MSTKGQVRKSPGLVLYRIAFRVLSDLAVQAGDGEGMGAPRPQEQWPVQSHRAVQPHHSVRADADAGR